MPETSDEHKLIKDLIKGDAFAFDEIFRRYNKRVYTFSLKNLKNKENAEGVVQEVFINLWEERSKLKDIKNLNAWIFTICFNIIRNRFRQLASDRLHLKKFANTSLSDDNTTATEIEYNDLLEKAEDIIEQLPTRQKVVFKLSKKEGL